MLIFLKAQISSFKELHTCIIKEEKACKPASEHFPVHHFPIGRRMRNNYAIGSASNLYRLDALVSFETGAGCNCYF